MFSWDEIETLATKWHKFSANDFYKKSAKKYVNWFRNFVGFFLAWIYFLVLSQSDVASFISIAAIEPIANTALI